MFWPPYTNIPLHPLDQLVWPFCTKDNVSTTIYHYFSMSTASTASTASTVHCFHCIYCLLHPLCTASTAYCIHWFDLFGPKTMSHHHVPLFHCIHWFDLYAPKTMSPPPYTTIPLCPLHPLCPLVWTFCTKDNVPTTIYHYSTASTVYCIHCILCPLHGFDLFEPKFTASTASTTWVWPFWTKLHCIHCIHCLSYIPYVGNLFALIKYLPHPPTELVTHRIIMNQKLVISNQYLMSPSPTEKCQKLTLFSLRDQIKPLR